MGKIKRLFSVTFKKICACSLLGFRLSLLLTCSYSDSFLLSAQSRCGCWARMALQRATAAVGRRRRTPPACGIRYTNRNAIRHRKPSEWCSSWWNKHHLYSWSRNIHFRIWNPFKTHRRSTVWRGKRWNANMVGCCGVCITRWHRVTVSRFYTYRHFLGTLHSECPLTLHTHSLYIFTFLEQHWCTLWQNFIAYVVGCFVTVHQKWLNGM